MFEIRLKSGMVQYSCNLECPLHLYESFQENLTRLTFLHKLQALRQKSVFATKPFYARLLQIISSINQ